MGSEVPGSAQPPVLYLNIQVAITPLSIV